jgi:hypothetical protein
LQECRDRSVPWRKWGPYLSERQWGTVREDYSASGNAWDYFPHDQARSRAYRWGEDGLAGISDDRQLLCFALALWNGRDPILKERLFGLTNSEGNHGEDVKEYYFYLDSTPTHSYMKYLFKYAHAAYPYTDLIATNRRRNRLEFEYELLDTGVFDSGAYFDVFVEFAKASPEDLVVRISVFNRGSAAAPLHVLPTLWFRNTWSWSRTPAARPSLRRIEDRVVMACHPELGERYLYFDRSLPLLFTENETNQARVFNIANTCPYVKDGINNAVVHNQRDGVNPAATGTKAAGHYEVVIPAGGVVVFDVRLTDRKLASPDAAFGAAFDDVLTARLREADEFYDGIIPPSLADDSRQVMRQAFAGMLWSK